MGQGAEDMDMEWARAIDPRPRADLAPSADKVAELVDALRPLAALPIGDATADDVPLYGLDGFYITHGDIRRARAALSEAEALHIQS